MTQAEKWLHEISTLTRTKFKNTYCCVHLKCFRHVNFDFYTQQAGHILAANSDTRRSILKSLLSSDDNFRFDGRVVCVRFLKEAFHFGTVKIAEVSSGKISRPLHSHSSSQSQRMSASTAVSNTPHSQSITSDSYNEAIVKKNESIISFLQRIADDCGDSMPHKQEVHLPFYQIQELYPVFKREFKKLYPSVKTPPTDVYFRRVWLAACPHIKIMKSMRFTVCETCDQLRTKIRQRILDGKTTEDLKRDRKTHLDFVSAERIAYLKKKDKARLHGAEFCSLIIDGADQSAFGIPHFITSPKSQKGRSMKVKLIGLLEHRLQNELSLYTMTEEHQTGANHIVETLHRFLIRKRATGPLPPKLFLQLDNCSRENKNRYVMAYLEFLVANSVFSCVEAGFLPVGHTHEDIDQAFSRTSTRLRVTNAITLTDLHTALRKTFDGHAHVEHMKRLANWSGLCDETNCLRKINHITQWRYFLFVQDTASATDKEGNDSDSGSDSEKTVNDGVRRTLCYVKKDSDNEWQKMYPSAVAPTPGGILRFSPDLSCTPDLKVTCPEGLDLVSKRFESEDQRVNDHDKMISLHNLRDFVFRSRTDAFHWDLQDCVETEYQRRRAQNAEAMVEDPQSDPSDASGLNMNPVENPASANVNNGEAGSSSDAIPNVAGEHQEQANTAVVNSSSVTGAVNEPNNKFDYQVGSIVVVKNQASNSDFWIAKVLEVFRFQQNSYISSLRVHWYDRDDEGNPNPDPRSSKFSPCYQVSQPKKRRRVGVSSKAQRQRLQKPWCDTIHTDTVRVSFAALTRKRTLPISVQKQLGR